MLSKEQETYLLKNEVNIRTSRSGGKGGQNVNKVETKVELIFNVALSKTLTQEQKGIIFKKHKGFVDGSNITVGATTYRSQLKNRQQAEKKLITLLNKLLKLEKKRRATKPTKSSHEKKLKNKKEHSEKKRNRKKMK